MTKMPDYKRLSSKECAELLMEIEKPLVLIHVKPDGDAVGSACALCEIFSQLGRECFFLSADKIPSRLSFIQEYVGAKLAADTEGLTAIAIDVASPTQLGALYESFPAPALMIDHHAVGERFADSYVVPEASSAAEALLDVAYELIDGGHIKMTEKLAYALYSAISSDTGSFAYSNTSPKTHRYAAALIECGIDSADINHRLFHSKSASQIKAEGLVAKKLKTDISGKVSYATITLSDIENTELTYEDFETAIDVARSLIGAEISFVAKETEIGKYKISLRSTGKNVASVARELGGGGHIRAAGCSVNAKSSDEAESLILSKLRDIQ